MSAAAESELARGLDESLAKILDTESLLDAAAADRPLDGERAAAIRALGVHAIAAPEEAGGLALGLAERVRLAAVMGRHLVPAATRAEAFGLVPALGALAAGEQPGPAAELLGRAAEGELRGAVALEPPPSPSHRRSALLAAVPREAEVLLVLRSRRAELLALSEDAAAEPFPALDAGQGLARLDLGTAPALAALSGEPARGLCREYEVLLACEAFGAGERALEQAAEYAEQRQQFGRPIASFQALAHLLAELKLGIETGRAGIGRYVDLDGESGRSPALLDEWAATLAHTVPAAARRACEGAIQAHGGIGFSWELGLHLGYRRVLAVQYELGGDAATAQRIGADYLARRSAR